MELFTRRKPYQSEEIFCILENPREFRRRRFFCSRRLDDFFCLFTNLLFSQEKYLILLNVYKIMIWCCKSIFPQIDNLKFNYTEIIGLIGYSLTILPIKSNKKKFKFNHRSQFNKINMQIFKIIHFKKFCHKNRGKNLNNTHFISKYIYYTLSVS